MAGPASANVSAKKKAHITRQLRKAVHKNAKVVSKKWFLKKASLVNFKLPVTIRLRGSSAATNPNVANIDLGASLGQREIDLGGSLAAEIVFHDSYDGGALGNVDVNILPGPKSLTSTSIPLLWNTQVSDPTTSWDSNLLGNPAGYPGPGCGNVLDSNAGTGGAGAPGSTGNNIPFGRLALPTPGGPGLPGVPIFSSLANYPNTPHAFAPAVIKTSGVGHNNPTNAITGIAASKITGDSAANPALNNNVGGNPDPFPASPSFDPGADGTTGQPNAQDAVLRTNALKLQVATPGEPVPASGVQGTQNEVLGKSGGQANLFGNIPGKSSGIDVTVNLATKISSIFRIVDQDPTEPLIDNGEWPAAVFSCGQIWSGYVQNYIPHVRLQGNLKIAPAITADGHLRIAKATLSSPAGDNNQIGVAACLAPYAAYNAELNNSDTVTPTVSPAPAHADGTISEATLPADPNNLRPAPNVACNAAPTAFVASTALSPATVGQLLPASGANGYTTNNDGSRVSVSGILSVANVSADILVGDTP